MTARTLMVQGTASSVGKSIVTANLATALAAIGVPVVTLAWR